MKARGSGAPKELVCARCAAGYPWAEVRNLCSCGGPLLVHYQWTVADPARLVDGRDRSLWRYRTLLPVEDPRAIVSLGEGGTPLLKLERLGARLGLNALFLKDESGNPTGSFKARGLSVAISRAKELGIRRVAIPSAGNAGSAAAAYAARAGLEALVVMPRDVPAIYLAECQGYGARVELVDGLITACGARVVEVVDGEGWFDLSTLKEPYRVEGKKTLGFELAEAGGWRLPQVLVFPTGGGTGLIGMWKAFNELVALGWLKGGLPRMVVVQAAGCAPLVKAFQEGREMALEWSPAQTLAAGLRVPRARGDFLILKILKESQGTAVAVEDRAILQAMARLAHTEGLLASLEGAASLAGLEVLLGQGWIMKEQSVVCFNTGNGLKDLSRGAFRLNEDALPTSPV